MVRLVLYIYGAQAVRTRPLTPEQAARRADKWRQVYRGVHVIETETV